MGRPDNIPTLIQIIGRSVRKYSHKYLPSDQNTVRIKIFTSCLPIFMSGYKKYRKDKDYSLLIKKCKKRNIRANLMALWSTFDFRNTFTTTR